MNELEMKQTAMEIHMLGAVAAKRTILAMEGHSVLAEAGISMLQFGVLRALHRQARTISELSQIMLVDPSTLVSVIDALERKELAERGQDPNDRRRVPISVTEKGAEIAACPPFKGPFVVPPCRLGYCSVFPLLVKGNLSRIGFVFVSYIVYLIAYCVRADCWIGYVGGERIPESEFRRQKGPVRLRSGQVWDFRLSILGLSVKIMRCMCSGY